MFGNVLHDLATSALPIVAAAIEHDHSPGHDQVQAPCWIARLSPAWCGK